MDPMPTGTRCSARTRTDAAVREAFAASMRAQNLTFGQRVHCPFLRPFFLTAATSADPDGGGNDRAARRARHPGGDGVRRIYDQLGITEAEDASIDIEPGYATASTASRLDAFLLPVRLHFAEYNAESPAGHRLHPAARRTVRRDRRDEPVPAKRPGAVPHASSTPARGAAGELPRLGRQRQAADDRHRRLARGADLDRVRDAARRVRRRRRPDGHLRSARAGVRRRRADGAGRAIDLVYRRVLVNDILAGPTSAGRWWTRAPRARSAWPTRSAASSRTRRRSSPSSPTRARALFSAAELAVIRSHVPWTRVLDDVATGKATGAATCSSWRARGASTSC